MAAQNSFILALAPTAETSSGPWMPKFFSSYSRRPSSSSRKQAAPPSMVLNTFVAWKLKQETSPKVPAPFPSFVSPKAWQAS